MMRHVSKSVTVTCIVWMLARNVRLTRSQALSSTSNNIFSTNSKLPDVEEDALLTVPQLVTKYGYPFESHNKIVSEDGYILNLHRIPHARNSSYSPDKPVVYIQPGFLSNSGDPVLAGPDNSIAYIFADAGYDVWIGNPRGTRYATKHTRFSRNNRRYWNFSWSDIGYYDIPAMVDYILKTTGQEKIYYIGHSRGTTVFYVMCSTRPEYNNKFRAMASLAPVSYMSNIPNPLFHVMAQYAPKLEKALFLLGINRIIPDNTQLARIAYSVCRPNTPTAIVCETIAKVIGGFDNRFNASLLPVFLGHLPDGLAVKELSHFGQLVRSGKFRNYDYGTLGNLFKYNSINPPDYDLSKVTAPVAVYHSANDFQSSVPDAEKLFRELGNPVIRDLLPDGPNHYGFFNGRNMKTYLYDKIINFFERY